MIDINFKNTNTVTSNVCGDYDDFKIYSKVNNSVYSSVLGVANLTTFLNNTFCNGDTSSKSIDVDIINNQTYNVFYTNVDGNFVEDSGFNSAMLMLISGKYYEISIRNTSAELNNYTLQAYDIPSSFEYDKDKKMIKGVPFIIGEHSCKFRYLECSEEFTFTINVVPNNYVNFGI